MQMLKLLLPITIFLFASCSSSSGKLRAPVKENGKYGYIDENGDYAVSPQFDDAWSFIRGTAVVKKDGMFGLIDKDGDYVVELEYDSIIPFSATCCIVQKGEQFGFMANGTGKMIIEPQFERVYYYTADLCVVQKGKSLGIVDDEAKLVCPVVMQDFGQMFGPGAVVMQHDTSDESMLLAIIDGGESSKRGLINRKGEVIAQPVYDEIYDDLPYGYYYPYLRDTTVAIDTTFDPEIGRPVAPGKYGILDTTGKVISKPVFEELPVYGEEMFRVRIGDQYGYADKTGNVVIAPAYDYAVAFSEGKAIVSKGTQVSIIDKTGKVLVENLGPGSGMYRFFNGLARYRATGGQPKYGFLDATGKRVIPAIYDVAEDFEFNRAIVSIDNKCGLIDRSGKFVVEPEYAFMFNLGDGFFQTKDEEGITGVVDTAGKEILPPVFEEVFHLQKNFFSVEQNMMTGCYHVSGKEIYPPVSWHSIYFFDGRSEVTGKDGKYGIIDTTGRFLLQPLFDSIGIFFKGYATVVQNGKYGAIDSTFKIVVTPKFTELRPFLNGLAVYRERSKYGYVDTKGNVVIDAKFEDAAVLVDPDRKEFE